MNDHAEQPDFLRMARNTRLLANDFELLVNLPILEGGAQITTRLDQLSRTMVEARTESNKHFEELKELWRENNEKLKSVNTRLDLMAKRQIAEGRNNAPRLCNNAITTMDGKLSPLYDLTTGLVLDGFPEDLRSLDSLSMVELNSLLGGLGEVLNGRADVKRKRLRMAIGVTSVTS